MSFFKPKFTHPKSTTNTIGLSKADYEGPLSTLCAGCGHDSISAAIVQAMWQLNIEPHRIAKMSGIGCSSKSPAYYLNQSHGFNSVHGRMPSVTTGASVADSSLHYIGISGDGDTASIGMGQFAHVIRRNLNMMYIVENNGCYGLTKGQDSATADTGSRNKKGQMSPYEPIDLVSVALTLGATFVARSFSGDKAQLVPLIQAAMSHKGFAFIDVISPCVTFNNHAGSTKSYDYTREHVSAANVADFVPYEKEITLQQKPGTAQNVVLHDGSHIQLSKINADYNPHDRIEAINTVLQYKAKKSIMTGLIYIDSTQPDFKEMQSLGKTPLNALAQETLCPGQNALKDINQQLV